MNRHNSHLIENQAPQLLFKMAPNSAPQPDSQAMTTLFGIKNCDTIKKARNWLAKHDIAYQFHDYRNDGLEQAQLEQWCNELGWEQVLNRRGTTWRKLPVSGLNQPYFS